MSDRARRFENAARDRGRVFGSFLLLFLCLLSAHALAQGSLSVSQVAAVTPTQPGAYVGFDVTYTITIGGATSPQVEKVVAESGGSKLKISLFQLEAKFNKHAPDFGVVLGRSRAGFEAFREALSAHVADRATRVIEGTYRGQAVTHFVNPETGLNVVRDAQGAFLTGWKLADEQLKSVLTTGRLF